ncbi:hypothetical protein EB796_013763 [Bugula neritina]|uniref:NOA1 n=1 Tax=Bugula neritina TaxID=10212 RepID=A0A7J7JPM0_BUGNE|nr:hypothetical protein EB796_013763 [Bugula neritina]
MNSLTKFTQTIGKGLEYQFTRYNCLAHCYCTASWNQLTLNAKKPFKNKKTKKNTETSKLSTVLPRVDNTDDLSMSKLNQQLNTLNSLLKEVNLKIAEQQEQLNWEEEEMQTRYGVRIPPEYLNMVGSVDPNCPPSQHTCVGCGTPIHCSEPHLPGFISSARFKALDNIQIQNCKCLRCKGLESHDVLLNAQVSAQEYRNILAEVKGQTSVILHVVDVTDYQNSTITDLMSIVGNKHPIYIIANKIDLLPKDSDTYLNHVRDCITEYSSQLFGRNLRQVVLVSALTGYGVEQLVTQLLKYGPGVGCHFHLVGCTNSGKSSLFNSLLMSDLCKEMARDKIGRATISTWPGTTLNLLKFPVNRPPRYMLALRRQRLMEADQMDESLDVEKTRNTYHTTLRGLVEPTQDNEDFDIDELKSTSGDYDAGSVESQYKMTRWNSLKDNVDKKVSTFDYSKYKQSRWLYDTPGLVNENQIINNMSMADLKRLLMKRKPLPRTYSLRPGMTMFIGGIGRIDILETTKSAHPVYLTVIAAAGLPVAVVYTEKAEEFYGSALAEDKLVIPGNDTKLDDCPSMIGHVFRVRGDGYEESQTDIQLSSIGWVAVTYEYQEFVTLKAYTPNGVGCHARPSLLPYVVQLKGQRKPGTRSFKRRKPAAL